MGKFLFILSAMFLTSTELFAACPEDGKTVIFPEYIVGFGEGASYQEAKAAALSDAVGIFGVSVDTEATTVEGNDPNSVYTARSVKTEINTLIKGGEVLSKCEENGLHKVTVGLKKSLAANIIAKNTSYREEWIKTAAMVLAKGTTPKIKNEFKESLVKILTDEKTDLDNWLILGRPEALFKRMPTKERSDVEAILSTNSKTAHKSITVTAADPLADKTLQALKQRLTGEGYSIESGSGQGDKVSWSCSITKGAAVGESVRFRAMCALDGKGSEIVDPIQVDSISIEGNIQDTAARLISSTLVSPAH